MWTVAPPEDIIEVQTWDSADAQQAFIAKIRGDFADVRDVDRTTAGDARE